MVSLYTTLHIILPALACKLLPTYLSLLEIDIISVLILLFVNPGWRQEPVTSDQHRVQLPVLLQPNDQPVEPASLPQHPQEQGRGGHSGWLHLCCRRLPGLHTSQHSGEVRPIFLTWFFFYLSRQSRRNKILMTYYLLGWMHSWLECISPQYTCG